MKSGASVASPRMKLPASGTPAEVFRAFLKLGFTSFGGPIAHIGYFRDELVVKRRWLDEAGFADLVALCQFLPGPASSQLGFVLGIMRAGSLWGGVAAWLAFTAPSALALVAVALGTAAGHEALNGVWAAGLLHGLKLVAVAVVAQAVWGMARHLAPDGPRAAIALGAVLLVVFLGGAVGQIGAIACGALAGLWLCRGGEGPAGADLEIPVSRRLGGLLLVVFALLLVVPPLLVEHGHGVAVFEAFYRSGALVFGGGHVVLPLLQESVVAPGWVSSGDFLAGYGLAQAVPGPLFTFAAYLGAIMGPAPHGMGGAVLALGAVFLPGLLLVTGMLPFWNGLRARPGAQAAMRGANAAVVGILGTALYSPVWTGAIFTPADFAFALMGFLLLTRWQAPPILVVALLAGIGLIGAIV